MKLSSKAVALGAAVALALPLVGTAVSANAQVSRGVHVKSGAHAARTVGKVHTTSVRHVVLRNLPRAHGAGVHKSIQPALGRNGKPAGSNLPTGPSRGVKPKAGTTSGPKVVQNAFDGIGLANSSCGCQPPDVNATIGPNHIVEAVNLTLAVYSKTGTLLQNTALSTFLGTGDGLSDPRVTYDPTWNRWALVLTDTSSATLWTAYSAGPDPTGGWYIYHFGGPFSALADYPMVGQDRDAFMYTTNNFDSSDNYVNSTAFSVPKSLVYNGFGWSASAFGVNINTTPSIVSGRPTQSVAHAFMLSPDDANNLMYVYSWTNTALGFPNTTLTFKGSIAYNWAAPPRRVNQPGTSQTLDPLDGRIDWAVSQLDGRLWFAHGAAIGSFPDVNWGFVNPSAMTISFSTAFHTGTSDDFNPSIAAQSGSSGTQEVLSWAYTDTPNGQATTDVYAIHGGTGVGHLTGATFGPVGASTGEFRFGDYSSVAPEYNAVGTCVEGTTSLVANQYFAADGTWKTRLARVHPSC